MTRDETFVSSMKIKDNSVSKGGNFCFGIPVARSVRYGKVGGL